MIKKVVAGLVLAGGIAAGTFAYTHSEVAGDDIFPPLPNGVEVAGDDIFPPLPNGVEVAGDDIFPPLPDGIKLT
ncbi:hypothetical protein KJK41_20035 [Bacillus haikouensis]|nr:hypothetical protein KJK41_20035 [Bacillus haikouensis]